MAEKMETKYGPEFKCIYQILFYNPLTGKPEQGAYCKHSLYSERKDKIVCPYLGEPMTIEENGKRTLVKSCKFIDKALR